MSPYSRTPVKGRTKSALIKGLPWRSSKRTWRAGGSSGEWTADEWKIPAIDELSERNRKFPLTSSENSEVVGSHLSAVIKAVVSCRPLNNGGEEKPYMAYGALYRSIMCSSCFFFFWVCVSCLSVCTHLLCVVYSAFVCFHLSSGGRGKSGLLSHAALWRFTYTWIQKSMRACVQTYIHTTLLLKVLLCICLKICVW